MQLSEYLSEGKRIKNNGVYSDGCSVVGWIVHRIWPQLEQACWSHDFARRGLIKTDGQYDNDKLFKDSLKYLGAPRPLRFILFIGVRVQDITGVRPDDVIIYLLFMIMFTVIVWDMITK